MHYRKSTKLDNSVENLWNQLKDFPLLSVSDSKNGARLEWWVKDLYNDSYHWMCIHYQITKIILFFWLTAIYGYRAMLTSELFPLVSIALWLYVAEIWSSNVFKCRIIMRTIFLQKIFRNSHILVPGQSWPATSLHWIIQNSIFIQTNQ